MDFEGVLSKVGSFGRFQKLLTGFMCLLVLLVVLQLYSQVFTVGTSDHWCRSWAEEECGPDLSSWECELLKRDLSVPLTSGPNGVVRYEQCYKYNVTEISFADVQDLEFYYDDNTTLDVIPCNHGWVHDTRLFPSTAVIEFELVCSKSSLPNLAQSLYFAGYLVGSSLVGPSADYIGRRNTLLVCIITTGCFSLVVTFSVNVFMFMVLRFLTGCCAISLITGTFIIGTEFVKESQRVLISNLMWIAFALGYTVIAGLAKIIYSWRVLHLVTSLPYFVVFGLAFFLVPESPRWLIAKDRHEEADEILRMVARVNKKKIRKSFTTKHCTGMEDASPERSNEGLRSLLSRPRFIIFLINFGSTWAVHSLVYFGLSFSTGSLGIDPYLSFVITGLVEIPAHFVCMYVPEIIGRKWTTVTFLFLAGAVLCITPIFSPGIVRALIAWVGKFFIVISYSVIFNWGTELMPTFARSSGLCYFSVCSRIGGIIAPLLLILGQTWDSLPTLVFGIVSIISALLCLFIPETMGVPFPTTMDDMDDLFGNRRSEKGWQEVSAREIDDEKDGAERNPSL